MKKTLPHSSWNEYKAVLHQRIVSIFTEYVEHDTWGRPVHAPAGSMFTLQPTNKLNSINKNNNNNNNSNVSLIEFMAVVGSNNDNNDNNDDNDNNDNKNNKNNNQRSASKKYQVSNVPTTFNNTTTNTSKKNKP
jgi:hypothetical protein